MQYFRTLGLVLLSFAFCVSTAFAKPNTAPRNNPKSESQQQLVESVDIQGNRRLRDDDLLYYIKTRPGDVFNATQLERDLKELLSLNFFDKTKTRVLTEEGPRGGVVVIFEVSELPIIRDLQFKGAGALQESDILKEFREKRVGISKEAVFNPVNVQKATRVIREMLASKGYPNAKVEVDREEVSATSIAITFNVEQGNRSRIIEIDFEGNEHFKSSELRGAMEYVKAANLISRFKGQDILDLRKLQFDLQKNVKDYMSSKGYFRAQIGEPQVVGLGYKRTGFLPYIVLPLPLLSSKDDTLKIIVPVTEGKVYRVGDVKVEGNSIFSEKQIQAYAGLQKGDIANGKRLRNALYEDLKKVYGAQGFVQYDADLEPEFKDNPTNPKEGIVDLKINIAEGKQFRLRRLEFTGNTFTRDFVLRREMIVNEGDTYNQIGVESSVMRLNQTNYFDPIDKDKDLEIRTDEEKGDVDLVVKVKEKGRQQIQFNGGIGGINGTTFGFEYSTNNLLGRGENFSISLGLGNRSSTMQFSFQEPYFMNRPITVGATIFGQKYKFFGEGTSLSQNSAALANYYNSSYGYSQSTAVDSNNLFTQTTYGASVFATTQLSEILFKKRRWSMFSRAGLTYQFSASTIKDPPVNSSGDASKVIPIIFAQPNIITSQITGSFVYDTRQGSSNGIDTASGRSFSASMAIAGLGGDVRTYQPSISYSQFIPVRRKKSKDPEVFAFRILAGTIGSFAPTNKIKTANSMAFINGVPFGSRYFMGSENDIRGYDSRSIGPIAPIAGYVTTKDVVLATNYSGTPEEVTGLTDAQKAFLVNLGTFTGSSGTNPLLTSANYQFVGGDTQLLGNFEYRIPIFGPASLAAFADVGSVFNIRGGKPQAINSSFLSDDLYIGAGTLTAYTNIKGGGTFQTGYLGGILLRSGSPITPTQYRSDYCVLDTNGDGVFDECPSTLPTDLTEIFVRGNAQTNTLIHTSSSAFSKLKDYRASVGLELRVQVPVVNVPFRLIYYYNPNIKIGYNEQVPGLYLPGKRSGFRFTVGRTF